MHYGWQCCCACVTVRLTSVVMIEITTPTSVKFGTDNHVTLKINCNLPLKCFLLRQQKFGMKRVMLKILICIVVGGDVALSKCCNNDIHFTLKLIEIAVSQIEKILTAMYKP